MQHAAITVALLLLAGSAQAQITGSCAAISAQQALPERPTMLAPVASELVAPRHQLGAPTGVLSQAFDESLSVDQVLLRMRIESCLIAKATPVTRPGMPSSTDPAAYKPRTEFDNAPWRFDMNQNGKRMTADDFTAWMEAKGVRVVPRAPVTTAAADGQSAAAPAPPVPNSGPDNGNKPTP